jgi:hypothetical protein
MQCPRTRLSVEGFGLVRTDIRAEFIAAVVRNQPLCSIENPQQPQKGQTRTDCQSWVSFFWQNLVEHKLHVGPSVDIGLEFPPIPASIRSGKRGARSSVITVLAGVHKLG